MNNSIFIFPQKAQFHPQRYQHWFHFLNKKKPEARLDLWATKWLLPGKTKLFSLINKFFLMRPNLVINFCTFSKTTKTNLNMIKSSSLGRNR
jgi:hypothetical protein